MAATPDLLTTVLGLLSGLGELRQRKMFGGTYIYCDDLFIATVHDGALYFKANANTAPFLVPQARGNRYASVLSSTARSFQQPRRYEALGGEGIDRCTARRIFYESTKGQGQVTPNSSFHLTCARLEWS